MNTDIPIGYRICKWVYPRRIAGLEENQIQERGIYGGHSFNQFCEYSFAEAVAGIAVSALLEEPLVWPRFGLVGPKDSGSHDDMDFALLLKSAHAIGPFFSDAVYLGLTQKVTNLELFHMLRLRGLIAEQTMFSVSGGVNTHKGCIFLLGLIAMSLGRVYKKTLEQCYYQGPPLISDMLDMSYRYAYETIIREFYYPPSGFSQTYGEWAAQRYGWGGMRATVINNFQLLRVTLTWFIMNKHISRGMRLGLLRHYLFVYCEDSNLLKRAGYNNTQAVLAEAKRLLLGGSIFNPNVLQRISLIEEFMVRRRWSGAGAGDLIAAFLFLEKLCCHGYAKVT